MVTHRPPRPSFLRSGHSVCARCAGRVVGVGGTLRTSGGEVLSPCAVCGVPSNLTIVEITTAFGGIRIRE